MSWRSPTLATAVTLVLAAAAVGQNQRDTAVRDDRTQLAADDSWFYDDLDAAIDAAAKSKRPIMVVFR